MVNSAPWFALGLLLLSTAIGLLLLTLHQVALVLLVTALGERLPLPWIHGVRRATILALLLALGSLTLVLGGLRQVLGDLLHPEVLSDWVGPLLVLAVLPWLLIPALMLTTELASSWRDRLPTRFHAWWIALVLGLRWICILCYAGFLVMAFALSYLHQRARAPILVESPFVLIDSLVFLGYLLLVPLPILGLLGLLGAVQRQVLHWVRAFPVRF